MARIACRLGRSRRVAGRSGDGGYTLVELLLVCVLVPVVVGAISIALISVLSLQRGVSNRVTDSADAQTVSATFEQDVQSAAFLTTSSTQTGSQCGPGKQLLGLEWTYNSHSASYQSVVSYVIVTGPTASELVRQSCAAGASSTPTSSATVAFDVPSTQAVPSITPTSVSTAAGAGWTATGAITGVKFAITEPGSNYSYTLVALPGSSASSNLQTAISPPTTNCGFATPGTGTYAPTLCFVDFTPYNATQAASPACQQMSASVTNTPYTIKFCMSVSGSSVAPSPFPTYFAPPTSEAFLGNNGFYTGVAGNPAIYQNTQGGTTLVTFSNIQVLDANGNAATGWQLVTGDAESTDQGESLTWTSNQPLNLLPNSPSSQIGNACAAPTQSNPSAIDLTGIGTTTVTCGATVSSDKTGTVMLEAAAPTTLSVQLQGAGLQATFVGLLLP